MSAPRPTPCVARPPRGSSKLRAAVRFLHLLMQRSPQRPRSALRDAARTLVETRGLAAIWPLSVLLRRSLDAMGWPDTARSNDRRVFEDRVLRHFAQARPALTVLSVGVRSYTRRYEALLWAHHFHTLDIDPATARWGSSQGHVVASVVEADRHFAPGSFDVVLMNGVFGWGLDRRADVEAAVRALHRLLRPGGVLMVGWNDVALRRPFAFCEVQALAGFEPDRFEGWGAPVLALGGMNRHRFEFYLKREPALV